MSTTPNINLPLMETGQAQKELDFNELAVICDILIGGVLDRDLTAPPGGESEGDAYIVNATATGTWAGHEDDIAYYFGGVYKFLPPEVITGTILWILDEAVFVKWEPGSPGSYEIQQVGVNVPAAVQTESGTSYSMLGADSTKYLRFTNAAAKTFNVQDEVDEALPTDGEWHIRNVGVADLTIVEDTAVTVNPPSGGTLVLGQGMTATLKRVAEDEFDLFGQTVAA